MKKKILLALFLALTMVMPTIGVSAAETEPTPASTEISVEDVMTDEPVVDEPVIDEDVITEGPVPEDDSLELFADYYPVPAIDSGKCGSNLTWVLDVEGTLTISGTGEMDDYTSSSPPWYDHRKSITAVIINNGVTSIGDCAFSNCTALTEIMIPEGVTSIGHDAFICCIALTEITIPDSVTSIEYQAFSSCEKLTRITIPDSVTSIGKSAFFRCKALTDISLPDGITRIEYQTFFSCFSLTKIMIPDSVTSIDENAFYYCGLIEITIPNSVTDIGDMAFIDCSSLTDVYYNGTKSQWNAISIGTDNDPLLNANIHYAVSNPNGTCGDNLTWELDLETGTLTISGEGNMTNYYSPWSDYAEGITSVVIEEGVTGIGDYAFEYCENLTEISLPEGLLSIGDCAFYWCQELTDVEIPASVTTIGDFAFCCCNNLTAITVAEDNPNYSSDSFGVLFNKDKTKLMQAPVALDEYVIPDGVVSLSKGAFVESEIVSLTIPDTVAMNDFCLIWEDYDGSAHTPDYLTTIRFTGDAPAFGENTFLYCEDVTIRYPGNNSTWTNDILQNYGGYNITWVAEGPVVVASGTCGDNLTWKLMDDGVLTISGTGAMYDYNYNDPAPWEDYNDDITSVVVEDSVTNIGDYAFNECRSLTEITIPDDVTCIGNSAFSGCENLTEIIIPDSVTSIGDSAFRYCKRLTKITIPEGVTCIRESAFECCDSLTEIIIPEGVTCIEGYVFFDCVNLTKIGLPGSLTSIGPEAFGNCFSLEEITIPKGVTSIGQCAFHYCPSLTEIDVAWGNMNYKSIEGILFSIDGKYLIKYPEAKTVTAYNIPDGVTSIGDYAFWGCGSSLEEITLPDSLTSIGNFAFSGCTRLTEITIPEGVTNIGRRAFEGCYSLTDVYYGGTEADWNAISIGTDNDALTNATIHFKDPCEEGHTEVTNEAKAPTCTETGLTEGKHCSVCGTVIEAQTVIPEKGHAYTGEITTETTCKKEGVMTYTCQNDPSHTYTEAIPKKDHTEVTIEGEEATCTETGTTDGKYCSVCRTMLTLPEVIPAKGHTAVIDAAVEPTCTETGLTEGKHCSVCSEVLVAQEVVPVKEHTEVIDNAKEPTCTETGLTEGSHCDVCGKVLTPQETIPEIGHDYVGNVTTESTCETEGVMTYTCQNDSSHTYTGAISKKDHTEVTIKGKEPTCTETGKTDMKYCSVCSTVIAVQEIIPAKGHTEVTDAGKDPTCTETGLTEGKHCEVCGEVTVAQTVIPVGDHVIVENICTGCHAYGTCGEKLKWEFDSSTGTLTISGSGYMNNFNYRGSPWYDYHSSIKKVLLSDDITTIGNYAFEKCSSLISIIIPNSVTTIGESAFNECSSLNNITMSTSITTIGNSAFESCTSLHNITLPDSVTAINEYAFAFCTSLTSVTIPVNLTHIGSYAFYAYDNLSLSDVYYDGTETEWKKISIWQGNDRLKNATIHFLKDPCYSGHTEMTDDATEPTCTETGLTEGKHCNVCGEVLVTQTVLPAKGHTFTETFQWASDLSSATAVLTCHCGHSEEQPCELIWDNSQSSRLTVTATLEMNEQTFSESKEISAVKEGSSITLTFDAVYSGLKISAAAYNSNGQMTAYKVPETIDKTVTLAISGDQIRIFFMTEKYCPISSFLQF